MKFWRISSFRVASVLVLLLGLFRCFCFVLFCFSLPFFCSYSLHSSIIIISNIKLINQTTSEQQQQQHNQKRSSRKRASKESEMSEQREERAGWVWCGEATRICNCIGKQACKLCESRAFSSSSSCSFFHLSSFFYFFVY